MQMVDYSRVARHRSTRNRRSDRRCSGRSANWATFNLVLSPAPSVTAENLAAIAPSPMIPDMVHTFSSHRKIEGKTVTQNLPSQAALRKAEREVAEFRRFHRSEEHTSELQSLRHL